MRWITLTVALSLTGAAYAQERTTTAATIWGIGNDTCATWLSTPASEREGDAWILGFWSSANIMNEKNHFVGRNTDGNGLLAQVKKVCGMKPTWRLSEATTEAYNEVLADQK